MVSTGRGISSLWGVQFSPLGGVGDQPFERSGPPFLGGRPRRLIGGLDDWAVAFERMCSGTRSAC